MRQMRRVTNRESSTHVHSSVSPLSFVQTVSPPPAKVMDSPAGQQGLGGHQVKSSLPDVPSIVSQSPDSVFGPIKIAPFNQSTFPTHTPVEIMTPTGAIHQIIFTNDSGATRSVLSRAIVDRLGLRVYPAPGVTILGDGSRIPREGITEVVGVFVSDYCQHYQFEVSQLGNDNGLLGVDLLNDFGMTLINVPSAFPTQIMEERRRAAADAIYARYATPQAVIDRDGQHDTPAQKNQRAACVEKVARLIQENHDLGEKLGWPAIKGEYAVVKLEHSEPPKVKDVFRPPYPIPEARIPFAEKEVGKWEGHDFIESVPKEESGKIQSNSPLLVAVVTDPITGDIVKERLCLDFRGLNKNLITQPYPMPRIPDLLRSLGGGDKIYTELDLRQAYLQFPVRESDRNKMAFQFQGKTYRFKRGIFGVANMTDHCQRVIAQLFRDFPEVRPYLDNIIVVTDGLDYAKHAEVLARVIARCNENNVWLNPVKCVIARREIYILGHHITPAGIRLDPRKVESVMSWVEPSDQAGLWSFLGFVGFLRPSVRHFAELAAPLEACKRVDIKKLTLTPEARQAFVALKHAIANAPLLQYPDWSKPLSIAIDASRRGIGGVLYQPRQMGDMPEHDTIVSIFSRALLSYERNYPPYKLELLGMVACFKRWADYLHQRKFTVHTDHRALTFLLEQPITNTTINNWLSTILAFNYTIVHTPGYSNFVADFLSRAYPETWGVGRESIALRVVIAKQEYAAKQGTLPSPSVGARVVVSDQDPRIRKTQVLLRRMVTRSMGTESTSKIPPSPQAQPSSAAGVADRVVPSGSTPATGVSKRPLPSREVGRGVCLIGPIEKNSGGLTAAKGMVGQAGDRGSELSTSLDTSTPIFPSVSGAIQTRSRSRIAAQTVPSGTAGTLAAQGAPGSVAGVAKAAQASGATERPTSMREVGRTQASTESRTFYLRGDSAVMPASAVLSGSELTQSSSPSLQPRGAEVTAQEGPTTSGPGPPTYGAAKALQTAAPAPIRAALDRDVQGSPASPAFEHGGVVQSGGDTLTQSSHSGSVPPSSPLVSALTQERREAIEEAHEFGHFGIGNTIARLKAAGHNWPNLVAHTTKVLQECRACQQWTPGKHRIGPRKPILSGQPGEHWQLDLITSLPVGPNGETVCLIVVDIFSNYTWLRALRDKETATIADAIWRIICDFGAPAIMQNDNEPTLVTNIIDNLALMHGAEHRSIVAYNPRQLGQAERQVSLASETIRKLVTSTGKAWVPILPFAQIAMNTREHSRTGAVSFELMFGRRANAFANYENLDPCSQRDIKAWMEHLSYLHSFIFPALSRYISGYKSRENATSRYPTAAPLEVGTVVMLAEQANRQSKNEPRYSGPFYVIKDAGRPGFYWLRDRVGATYKLPVPVERLKILDKAQAMEVGQNARDWLTPQPPPEDLPSDYAYPEDILDHKTSRGKVYYLVKWLGYSDADNTWEPAENIPGVWIAWYQQRAKKRYVKRSTPPPSSG